VPVGRGRETEAPGLLVARGGIEPPTYRFSGGRSYQLSYLAVPGVAMRDAPQARARVYRTPRDC
jgi:hypothetical protein